MAVFGPPLKIGKKEKNEKIKDIVSVKNRHLKRKKNGKEIYRQSEDRHQKRRKKVNGKRRYSGSTKEHEKRKRI